MEFEPDISKLENVVNRLLEEYDVVNKKCEQLTVDLAESSAQVEALKEENHSLLNDKNTVHSRVTSILEKLSHWEDGVAGDTIETDNATPDETVKDTGGQLFSMGSPTSS